MQHDEAHAREDMSVNALDGLFTHFVVRNMRPPNQYIGLRENFVGDALVWFIERRDIDLEEIAFDAASDGDVHALGIDRSDLVLFSLMPKLIPNEHSDGLRHVYRSV